MVIAQLSLIVMIRAGVRATEEVGGVASLSTTLNQIVGCLPGERELRKAEGKLEYSGIFYPSFHSVHAPE